MKIAIQQIVESSFHERWIEYCDNNNIPYKLVNCYDLDIIQQLKDCDALMWFLFVNNYKDALFGKQLLYSLEISGKKTFPNFSTGWHYDDKVGQKYLLESIGAPMVPSYVFYSKKEALDWIKTTTFPKVFKLRGGASSANVRLVQTKRQAMRLVNKAFGRGFSQFNRWNNLKDRIGKYKLGKDTFIGVCKGIARLFIPTEYAKMHAPEKGYIYFQDFIPDNHFDIRVIVIGDKAFAIKRMVRNNDFRASGSGMIIYDKKQIPEICVKIAFDVNRHIKSQCIAYDFVFDGEKPLIVELSYAFLARVYDPCEGYWNQNLEWHEGSFNPYGWMIEDLMK
jgi:glutathione synthase/RimK-type ligase-like ATP-grasp enzyme